MTIRAFTLFSEYGRQDSSGNLDTLVGVFPSLININKPPIGQRAILGLHAYTSIQFDRGDPIPKAISLALQVDGKTVASTPIDPKLILGEMDRVSPKNLNIPYAQVISRVAAQGLELPTKDHAIESVVNVDGSEIRAGFLRVRYV